ncbi:hypothetical protein ROA7745_03467 [Roseovarius aestuarii]|uniref:Uncharacterized protein n=2 Tax=Roseovarius aestuarii TaxID=475083 RepID=A0A1X7BVU9_9RHOB|nr:hypothetical protein ROA7745_03467 [Roseovarius aestuarii]
MTTQMCRHKMSNPRRRSLLMRHSVLSALFATLFSNVALAQQPNPNNLLDRIELKCAEQEFMVWGSVDDLHVQPGGSAWVSVDGPEVVHFCGSYEDRVYCPAETATVWITRSYEFEVLLACYR